jgi:hypothetical protein
MDFEVGKIYMNNNNDFRKILNISNDIIEYEKLEVIKCEDMNSFSNWASAGSEKEKPIIDKIEIFHFSTNYSRDLEGAINDWISDMNYKYNIIDIDIKYDSVYSDSASCVKYSALVILKLQEF